MLNVAYYFDELMSDQPSIYLAGPTLTTEGEAPWHDVAICHLERRGFEGAVCVPKPRDGIWRQSEAKVQSDWQRRMLASVSGIAIWLPRPGIMSAFEFGRWLFSGRLATGGPVGVKGIEDLLEEARIAQVPTARFLAETLDLTLALMARS